MKTDRIGIYLHIPFCIKKCMYCDFCSFPLGDGIINDDYICALCDEIDSYREKGIAADTVFFGGGTPSLLRPEQLTKILYHLRQAFQISTDAEITMEANPGTVTERVLSEFRKAGINRLSFGLQSIHENELKLLGRIHSFADFEESFESARRADFNNINIDVMYGIPEQTEESFSKTLKKISELSPEHISVYGLILEEGTPLHKNKTQYVFPTEDEECDMYYNCAAFLSKAGYCHYEISNYSKSGFECRHNIKYWRDEEYVGLGLNAHSYFDGVRFSNTSDFAKYLNRDYLDNADKLSSDEKEFEFAMLALRLKEGLSNTKYRQLFGKDFISPREKKIEELRSYGLVITDGDRVALTEKGFYVSNTVMAELL